MLVIFFRSFTLAPRKHINGHSENTLMDKMRIREKFTNFAGTNLKWRADDTKGSDRGSASAVGDVGEVSLTSLRNVDR